MAASAFARSSGGKRQKFTVRKYKEPREALEAVADAAIEKLANGEHVDEVKRWVREVKGY